MVRFIDTHRGAYGVEPICAVLPIAPSRYYEAKARERTPERRPVRTRRDEVLAVQVQRVWREHRTVYGVRKVWKQLGREGYAVARCTVARLMRRLGLAGVVRGRCFKVTTTPDLAAARPPDLVSRQFTADRPNQLWVADLTYGRDPGRLRLRRGDLGRLVAQGRRIRHRPLDRCQVDAGGLALRHRQAKTAARLRASHRSRLAIRGRALSAGSRQEWPRRIDGPPGQPLR